MFFSFNIIISKFIHAVVHIINSFLFVLIFHCIDRLLDCVWFMTVTEAAMKIYTQILIISFLLCRCRIFNFERNSKIAIQNDCTNLHFQGHESSNCTKSFPHAGQLSYFSHCFHFLKIFIYLKNQREREAETERPPGG